MDDNTNSGYAPEYVARKIIDSMCLDEEEVFIARYISIHSINLYSYYQ